jgi:hypothetical protein
MFATPNQKTLATGIYGNVRDGIAPRGVIGIPQEGPVYAGSAGIYWDEMPGVIGGQSNYGALSTVTGVSEGTPDVGYTDKVGGGRTTAQIPDYGGTAAF